MANNQYINRVDVVRGNSTDTLINISDTTAVASDVASGKYFYLASGEKVAGTSSGGGGGSVTQDANGFIVLPETGGGGGGGATNCVCGTFTTSSTTGAAQTITVPYTGSGFPMTCTIYLPEGYKNEEGTVYSTVHQYGIIYITLIKNTNGAPEYSASDSDYGYRGTHYKSNATDGTSYSSSGGTMAMFSTNSAGSSVSTCARFNSSTQLSVYVNSAGGYGLIPSTEYAYCIGYSS